MPPPDAILSPASPSPLRGGDRGGGNHAGSGIPPSLSLPHTGGGNVAAREGDHDHSGCIWRDVPYWYPNQLSCLLRIGGEEQRAYQHGAD